jgi:hypothetical protein
MLTEVQTFVPIMWHPGRNQTSLWLHSPLLYSFRNFSSLFWKGFIFFFFSSLASGAEPHYSLGGLGPPKKKGSPQKKEKKSKKKKEKI